mgnify:CR=1 FL=1
MSGSDSGDDGVVTGINVTPLVDVVLVLLIIFMVTAHFTSNGELKINLPKSAAAEAPPTAAGLIVSLDGEVTVLDSPLRYRVRKQALRVIVPFDSAQGRP